MNQKPENQLEIYDDDFNVDDQIRLQEEYLQNQMMENQETGVYKTSLTSDDITFARNVLRTELHAETELDIVHLPRYQVHKVTKWSEEKTNEFFVSISMPLCSNITTATALEMKNDNENPTSDFRTMKLSTGCQKIDRYLRGGIISRAITEIVGSAGCGKTQLCLQLALQAQLPVAKGGLGGRAIYISTEDFPFKRLKQMSEEFAVRNSDYMEEGGLQADDLLGRIFVQKCPTIQELWGFLESLPNMLKAQEVKLIILDSIAALYRYEYSLEESMQRSKMLWKQATQLKLLSDLFNIPVVVTNQVSDLFHDSPLDGVMPAQAKVIPALGLTWSNCVNVRIMLMRTNRMITPPEDDMNTEQNVDQQHQQQLQKKRKGVDGAATSDNNNKPKKEYVPLRSMHIILASHLPNRSCNFIVERRGVVGVDAE